jgi:hypothetical protein
VKLRSLSLIFLKEHPVLRQLNAPSQQSQDHTQFILAGGKDSQTTFDEVYFQSYFMQMVITNVLCLARGRSGGSGLIKTVEWPS